MFNGSFDYNKIVYASSKSRLTAKSKRKLDELAAQVALWNQECFNKRRRSISGDTNMRTGSTRSRLTIDEKSKPFFVLKQDDNLKTTPVKSVLNDMIIATDRGSVRKKAAFFESLVTPQKQPLKNNTPWSKSALLKTNACQNLIVPLKDNAYIMKEPNMNEGENKYIINKIDAYRSRSEESKIINDKENVNPSRDEDNKSITEKEMAYQTTDDGSYQFPSPPSENGENTYESDSCNLVEDDESIISEPSLSPTSSDNLTNVSNMDKSLSLLEDIYAELRKRNYTSDTESLDIEVSVTSEKSEPTTKLRRSLSWSDKVHYINPSSSEEDTDKEDTEDLSRSFSDPSLSFNDDPNFDSDKEQKNAAEKSKECMEYLQKLLRSPHNVLGGQEHTAACLKLVECCLAQQSIAERVKWHENKDSAIEGYLEMQQIQLAIKDGYVVIDYSSLEKCNRGADLQKLKKMYHVVLLVRCRGDPQIKASCIYTIIPQSEANKFKLPHDPATWLSMFEYVKFSNLLPGFKFIFELYSMKVTPRQYACSTKTLKDIRQLLGHRTPSEHTPDRSLFFTNIGSFSVTAAGLRTVLQQSETFVRVHADCPFMGKVVFATKFSMRLVEKCQGRLNVYEDISGVGSWSFFECELFTTSMCGWRSSGRESTHTGAPDLDLPFHLCLRDAEMCDYTVCAKANTFSVCLDTTASLSRTPINRRVSVDGFSKRRFLAEAGSYEESRQWCRSINLVREAFIRWAHDIAQVSN